MKILHLAAGNRWTGAAAPAFAEVEALRGAGVDAHYAYVGGYKLEAKIGHHDFAHAVIQKSQNPISFTRTLGALDRMIDRHGFDVIHAHLTYDHSLARIIARNHKVALARTFHARRVLRTDVFTKMLVARTPLVCVVNSAFVESTPIATLDPVFTPPPVDHRQFSVEGGDVRGAYGIPSDARVIVVIGKLSPDRGFEAAIDAFAALRNSVAGAKLMIIGHGPHRPVLESHAESLGIARDVIWAGYHEDDLAEHYRAADLLFFTARGSDEGHRAVLEAMACGVVPACYPLEGVERLTGRDSIAQERDPRSLAALAATLLARDLGPARRDVAERSIEFGYDAAAQRLIAAYDRVIN